MAHANGVNRATAWKPSGVNSSGTHAPPKPERTNMGISEKTMVCSSFLESTPISKPRAVTKSTGLDRV